MFEITHSRIMLKDEFVDWLVLGNAGMFDKTHLYCIDYAMRNLPSDSPIIEIGSFCGLSTNILLYYKMVHERDNKLITCDKWMFEGAGSNEF